MKKENWVWMPHPGHFICSSDCRFVLNTYIGGYVVSTVGEYWPDSRVRAIHAEVYGKKIEGRGDEYDANYFKEFGYEQIGYGRMYETMVFKARRDTENACCSWHQTGECLDFEGYNTAEDAYKGHLKMCQKWSNPSPKKGRK